MTTPITEEHCIRFRNDFVNMINGYRRQEELTKFKALWNGEVVIKQVPHDIYIKIAGEKSLPAKLKYNIAGMRNRLREGRYI